VLALAHQYTTNLLDTHLAHTWAHIILLHSLTVLLLHTLGDHLPHTCRDHLVPMFLLVPVTGTVFIVGTVTSSLDRSAGDVKYPDQMLRKEKCLLISLLLAWDQDPHSDHPSILHTHFLPGVTPS